MVAGYRGLGGQGLRADSQGMGKCLVSGVEGGGEQGQAK